MIYLFLDSIVYATQNVTYVVIRIRNQPPTDIIVQTLSFKVPLQGGIKCLQVINIVIKLIFDTSFCFRALLLMLQHVIGCVYHRIPVETHLIRNVILLNPSLSKLFKIIKHYRYWSNHTRFISVERIKIL